MSNMSSYTKVRLLLGLICIFIIAFLIVVPHRSPSQVVPPPSKSYGIGNGSSWPPFQRFSPVAVFSRCSDSYILLDNQI